MQNLSVVFSLFLLTFGVNGQNLSTQVRTLTADVDSELTTLTPVIRLKLSEETEAKDAFGNLRKFLPLELLQTENVNKIFLSMRILPIVLNGTDEGNCFEGFDRFVISNFIEQQVRSRFDQCGKKYFSSSSTGDKYLTDLNDLGDATKRNASDCAKTFRTNPRFGKICIDRARQSFFRTLTSLKEAFNKEYTVNYVEELIICIEQTTTRAESLINDVSSILTNCIVQSNPNGKVSSELQTYFPFIYLSGVTNQFPWSDQDVFKTDVEFIQKISITTNATVTYVQAGKALTLELAKQQVSILLNQTRIALGKESERLASIEETQICVSNFQDAIAKNLNISAINLLTCVKNIKDNPSLEFTNVLIGEFTQWKFTKSLTRLQCISLVDSVVTRDGITKCMKEIEDDDKLFIDYVKTSLDYLLQDATLLERQVKNCNTFSNNNVRRQLQKDAPVFESCVTKATGSKYTFSLPA